MHVTLVIPPVPYMISDKVFPPLGILYVASFLRSAKQEVQVLDLTGQKDWKDILVSACGSCHSHPDVIALTCTTPDFPQALQMLSIIKDANPAIRVAIGGPHPTVAPTLCTMFDTVVGGDGWDEGWLNYKGIYTSKMLDDFDSAPFPARDLIDMKSYHYKIAGREATSVMSQLGCPYGCVFCCGRDLKEYRKMRLRSVPNIMQELDSLHEEYGYNAFMFFDDEVNIINEHILSLCRSIKDRGYRWRGFIKANLFTEQQAQVMAEAGCYELCTGVESGSLRILQVIQKATTPEINKKFVELCRKYGIRSKCFTIVGLPSATLEDEMMTKQWLIDAAPDEFDVTVNTPYPGAPEFDHREKFDLEFSIDYSKDVAMYKGIPGNLKSFVRTSALSFEDLSRLRDEIDRDARKALNRPPPAMRFGEGDYDHSMGQGLEVYQGVAPEVAKKLKEFYGLK